MKIKYSKRETRNLGNYENVTIEVSVEDEVGLTESNDECFLRLKTFVNERLATEFNAKLPKDEDKLDIEEVKNKFVNLIKKDKNNRDVIKNILNSYNATKIQDLNSVDLEKFNIELGSL